MQVWSADGMPLAEVFAQDEQAANGHAMAAAPAALEALQLHVLDLDELAERFRSEVGMMAPFKDVPAAMWQPPRQDRQAAWDEWYGAFRERRLELGKAALKKAGVRR